MRYVRYGFLFVIIFVIIIASIFLVQGALACLELKVAKASYLPGETAQLELDANVTRPLFSSDIAFYREAKRLPIAIFLSKVTDTKWFAWFEVPSQPGLYTVRARGFCPELRIVQQSVEVEPTIASRHSELETRVKGRWKTLPLESHVLAAGALAHNEALHSEALAEYVGRSDSCARAACSTEQAALALAALKDRTLREKMQDMLEAYQNYVKGSWQLQLDSDTEQQCNLTLDNSTANLSVSDGINFINLTDMMLAALHERVEIKLSCETNVSGKLVYSHKGFEKEFELVGEENELNAMLDSSGCWGTGLKTECNASASAYALLALALTNSLDLNSSAHVAALLWLREHAASVEEKAILFYITEDNETLAWLLDVQTAAGFWPTELYEPDIKASALALFALKSSTKAEAAEARAKAEAWLKAQTFTLSDEAFILFFAFPGAEIEPLLAVWPGLIKAASRGSFDLILTNKGTVDIKLRATLLNSSTTLELPKESMKNMRFSVPLVTTLDGRSILSALALDYSSVISDKPYSYSVPTLIFTEQAAEEYTGEPNATEQEINATQQQQIINETKALENATTELNVSLIAALFVFSEKRLALRADTKDAPFEQVLNLTNRLDKELSDIELSPSITLLGLVEISPLRIEKLAKDESVEIRLRIAPAVTPKLYKGFVKASARYDTTAIETSIPVAINITAVAKELSCSELGGKSCVDDMECENPLEEAADTLSCCIPAEACKARVPAGRNIGLAIIAVVIVILLILLLWLRRRPKKEMKAFLEERAKEYEKERRIKRPPSITGRPRPGLPPPPR